MSSDNIDVQIQLLHRARQRALNREARQRCKALFGTVPRKYGIGNEEMLGAVARIYVLRAYKREDLRDKYLPDHEWIALWHKYDARPLKELLLDTEDYIAGGCGISG